MSLKLAAKIAQCIHSNQDLLARESELAHTKLKLGITEDLLRSIGTLALPTRYCYRGVLSPSMQDKSWPSRQQESL